jgi:hypothetical protein
MSKTLNQSGSALWFILIGIVLFGAVSAAVTQGGKGKAKLAAGEIINYANQVSQAVRRVMMVNDCADTEISFYNSVYSTASYLHSPVQPDVCRVFETSGGGIFYATPNDNFFEYDDVRYWYFTGQNCVINLGSHSGSCDSSEKELLLLLYGLKKEICESINLRFLGTKDITDIGLNATLFNGVYTVGTSTLFPALGKSFCVKDNNGVTADYYVFMHVLIAR